MTAWARAGRTAASPSRLARSAPPLRGRGRDRLCRRPGSLPPIGYRVAAAEQRGAKVAEREGFEPSPRRPDSRFYAAFVTLGKIKVDSILDHFWTPANTHLAVS